MAETGIALAAARAEAVAALAAVTTRRRERNPESPFPWSSIALEGTIDRDLAQQAAVDVEDGYVAELRDTRVRDRGAGRTLSGPHRTDLIVSHGPKTMPARLCSTGEQKALLLGLVLAHAELVAERRNGVAPMLLLDEIAAHLDVGAQSRFVRRIAAPRHAGLDDWDRPGSFLSTRRISPILERRGRPRRARRMILPTPLCDVYVIS